VKRGSSASIFSWDTKAVIDLLSPQTTQIQVKAQVEAEARPVKEETLLPPLVLTSA
jgi:hypothetical protein